MAAIFPFSPAVDRLIELALEEDLGAGDLTSDALFDANFDCQGVVLAKSALVVAGLELFGRILRQVDPRITVTLLVGEGTLVNPSTPLATLEGGALSVLRAERTALNFLCHLSGIATLTHRFVQAAGPEGPRICDTRKTTPGMRELEKYAVRMGGGKNHRFNLGSAVMIKDNHIAAMGSISRAVHRIKQAVPHTTRIEVEVSSLDQLDEALEAGADIILLDNMTDDQMKEAVEQCHGRAITEASGGITLERIRALATIGLDVISSGALTHSAPAADISLDLSIA
ncbi:MAG: carboxylating nicotinate-nucleotide diphosphorylase [Bradymonadales bacterium]|nr:carboxylating nicotinate-nucleotide diphosphorylase [Bradymonadales bacterium]